MPNTNTNPSENSVPQPVFRRLRGYAFDPSLSLQLDTALVNEAVFKVCWEKNLQAGPIGEYLEISLSQVCGQTTNDKLLLP